MSFRGWVPAVPLVVEILILFCICLRTRGFNIDTKNVRVLSGPRGSLFGYTAKFLPQTRNEDTLSMVVGAPNNSTKEGGLNSGTMHICTDVLDSSGSCRKTVFFDDDVVFVNTTLDEGFGSSVAVAGPDTVLVCSPQWKDTAYLSKYYTFMPGRCSLCNIKNETKIKDLRPFYVRDNIEDQYVIRLGKKDEYYKGLASFGFSTDSTQDSVFAFGSPGVLMFEGSVRINDDKTGKFSEFHSTLTNKLDTTAYGYLGYSVKIGKFCDGDEICLAAGAPNQNRVGNVYLFKWTRGSSFLSMIQILSGMQAWSYFGYTLCAADVDKDGYDELLVGAPHHTDTRDTPAGYDQGRVFVYSRTGDVQALKPKVTLDGNKKKFARFGSAIQSIGDINLDSYIDIAVGAPGEDEGQGCLYVYLGSSVGLIKTPSQRITAEKLSTGLATPLKGLGYVLSDYEVLQNEKYPVFAATSVVSDSVVILKCRPIVDVTPTLNADPNPVDIEQSCNTPGITKPCFKIDLYLDYDIRGVSKRRLNFLVGLDIDTKVKSSILKRALFRLDNGTEVESIPMTKEIKADRGIWSFTAILRENQVNKDRFTPVRIIARYMLDKDTPTGLDPVLDALKPSNVTLDVTFVNECGDDNTCQVDLSSVGSLDYTPAGSYNSVVVNETKELIVKLDVKNANEPSYWTFIKIKVNSPLPFSRFVHSNVPVSCKAVEPSASDITDDTASVVAAADVLDETTVECNHIKPLGTGENIELHIAFDTEDIDLSKKSLKITAEAMPKKPLNNPEIQSSDNTASMMTNVEIISDVSIDGSSSPSEVTVDDPKKISQTTKVDISEGYITSDAEVLSMNLTHKILVRNIGPSFLPQTTIEVGIPMFLPDGTQFVHEADVKLATADGQVTQCFETVKFQPQEAGNVGTTTAAGTTSTPEGKPSSHQPSSGPTSEATPTTTTGSWFPDIGVNRKKREADESGKVLDKTYLLSCNLHNEEYCQIFQCDLNAIIDSGSHAEINVSMVIDKANVPIPEDFNSFYFLTRVRVKEPNHPLFRSWDQPGLQQILTIFHFLPSGGGKVNIWIIIGCVIGGLVLITLIVIILWKLGFFKRDKHHQVERWKRESVRRSKYTPAATE